MTITIKLHQEFKRRGSLLLVLIIISTFLSAQPNGKLNFKSFSVNDGLSQYDVTAVLQDDLGYIWVGTYDGLNRLDGYQPKIFRHTSSNGNSIKSNRILSLERDADGNIWVGSDGGALSIYNIKKATFFEININIPKTTLAYNYMTSEEQASRD